MDDQMVLLTGPDEHGTAVLTLNRPAKKNAMSVALRDQASALLDQLAADDVVKALIITGAGGSFSAGFDLGELQNPDAAFQQYLWESSDRFHQAAYRFPLPVIAAVDGVAYAGGFDLAVLCDLRIAAPSARFAHPESTFGPVVYGPLHDLVGGAVARELVLTGRVIDAETALRMHLVSEITEPGALADRALELAHQVSRAPRQVLIRNKAKFLAHSGVRPGTATLDL
jgi:enoyl-CoA hydratase/carnithine racemase